MFAGLPEDTTYAELLEFLKRDLRLDAGVDVLSKSVIPDNLAPQLVGQVTRSPIGVASGSVQLFTGAWDGFTAGTYTKASAAGLTVTRAGIYLAVGQCRFDANATSVRGTLIAVNTTQLTNSFVVTAASAGQPGTQSVQHVSCAVGDVIQLGVFQNTGASQTITSAALQAYWVGNSS